MDDNEAAIRSGFAQQAEWCVRLGSPLTGLLCRLAGQKLSRSTAVGLRILDWPAETGPLVDAVPLRLTGGLNALVRRGALPELALLYPPHELPGEDVIWPIIERVLVKHEAELLRWLDSPPQTNEVGRSSALMAGLLVVGARFRLPFALYELGPSAGLNLLLDRYGFQLGDTVAGDVTSPLQLAPAWQGASPPQALVQVVARRGVDLRPLNVALPADRERLLAYVWPDQAARVAQLETALRLAAVDPPVIDTGDAGAWTENMVSPTPQAGVTRVLMHTIALQYFPPATRALVKAHAFRVGERATASAPFAWLNYEVDVKLGGPALRLKLWPDGETQVLATGDPHGRSFAWLA